MNQFKRAQVIMLPTENKSSIWSHKGRRLYYNQNNPNDVDDEIRYNIYIISDDEIKEGKENIYYYDTNFNKISKWIGESNTYCKTNFKEIVATTDTSLMTTNHSNGTWNYLPQPSQQFIEKYIKSYNKGEVITDVLVEYENYTNIDCKVHIDNSATETVSNIQQLKINPKDNTITIKKLKDSWDREEVIELLNQCYNLGYNSKKSEIPDLEEMLELDNWIDNNL